MYVTRAFNVPCNKREYYLVRIGGHTFASCVVFLRSQILYK